MKTPKLTIADIHALIASEHYFTAGQGAAHLNANNVGSHGLLPIPLHTLTFCVLVLKNGHTVTGEAFCADPDKFVSEDGQHHAREAAVSKIWPMAIYAERERLARAVPTIIVDVKNEILGDSTFWRGPVSKVHEIRNIPARETAMLVAKDGKARSSGMWRVRLAAEGEAA